MLWHLNCISVFSLHANWKITILLFKNIANLNIPLSHHRKKKYKVKHTKKVDNVNRKYNKMFQGVGKEVEAIHRY